MCKSVAVTSFRAFQHTPSAWTGFVPKLTIKSNTGFISYPRSLNNETILFDSDPTNAAAHSSDSALLLAMLFLLSRECIQSMIAMHYHAPALDDFRVSKQPAQSESVNVVTSSTNLPYPNI